jgi:uncharacterized OsmC-like protein
MTITYLNEVDLPTVDALIESIRGDRDKAQTTWKSEVTWEGALRTAARSRDFEPVAFDGPPTLGGTNTAPNPVEQIPGALGSCLVVGYAANASAAGISAIQAIVYIESDADDQAIEAVHRKVVSTSPVGHTLSGSVPVGVDLA